MKRLLFIIISLVGGSILGLLAYYAHNVFFCLLPLLVFVLGYYSSWGWGLVCGLLLFLSYTIAPMLTTDPGGDSHPIIMATFGSFLTFFGGGFSLPVIGVLAPLVRRGVRKPEAVTVLVISALLVSYCGYLVFTPVYSYYYQVIVKSSEELNDLELYVPMGTVSSEPYLELFEHVEYAYPPAEYYSVSLTDTEHGRMLKLDFKLLAYSRAPKWSYNGNIMLWLRDAPHEELVLAPRYNGEEVEIPVMAKSGREAEISLHLTNRYTRYDAINFSSHLSGKGSGLSETYEYEGKTSDDWVLVPKKY